MFYLFLLYDISLKGIVSYIYIHINKILNLIFFLFDLKVTLKELRHDILSHFFDGLSHGLSVGKTKTKGLF